MKFYKNFRSRYINKINNIDNKNGFTLLTQFKNIVKKFPSSPYSMEIVKYIPHLTKNKRKTLALILAFPSFGMMTAYAIDDNNALKPKFNHITQVLTLPEIQEKHLSTPYWQDNFVKPGDNLTKMLNRLGINENSVQNLLQENPIPEQFLQFHPDQAVSILMDEYGDLSAFQYFQDDDNGEKNLIAIEKVNGQWQLSTDSIDTDTVETLRVARVQSSARGSLARIGVPISVRESISEIFSDQFTLDDLNDGDIVTVIYDTLYFRGQEIGTGDIKAVEITKKGKKYTAYYLKDSNDNGAYYNQNGRPVVKGFQIAPLTARISSSFGTRVHPITRKVKMHTGIDYAAPHNTPIRAPADGVIQEVGRKGGYGNTVVIQHKKGMTTLYAHMSRFQSGIQAGKTVTAGTVIGYVGSTGLSTGNHLHWEVRINNQPVDPSTNALPAREMPKSLLTQFQVNKAKLNDKFALTKNLAINIASND